MLFMISSCDLTGNQSYREKLTAWLFMKLLFNVLIIIIII